MFSYKRKYCSSFLLYFLISVPMFYSFDVKAQVLPRPISVPALENQRLEDLRNQKRDEKIKEISKEYQEKKEKEKPLSLDDESKDVSDKDNVVIMYVYFINFDPSKVFSKEYFQNIKDKYEEKNITLKDVKDILNQINEDYKKKGLVASKAFIKEQDLTDHILDISLIEGVVEEVLISKNSYTDREYFEKSFDIKQDSLVNIKEIEQKVLDFNASNDAKARVALQPGKSLGKTLVETVIEEPKRFSFDAFSDNAGQEQTGIHRFGAFSSAKGILPFKMLRDSFSIGGVTSKGANSLFTSYSITEPYLNTTWNIGLDYSDTKIIEGELVPLDITGDSYNYHLSVRRPVYVSENIILGTELLGNIKDGSTYIGSYETQRVRTDTLTFSFDNLFLYNGGYFFSKLGMTKALEVDAGEGHFTHYNYQGEVEQYLIKGFSANLKLKTQYADDDMLPSSDQIQIGGVGSVRGYKEGLLTGDRGLSLMSELKYDLKQYIDFEHITRAETFVFYDFGRVMFKDTGDISGKPSGVIESAGFGLRSQLLKRIDTSFTVAFPLTSHKYNDYKKDGEFLFNVQLKLW